MTSWIELSKGFQRTDRGKAVIFEMARSLSEQTSFPDLRNWEDSAQKIANASKAVAELKSYMTTQEGEIVSEREREAVRAKARDDRKRIQRSLTDKAKLQQRLDALHKSVGTQQGGYDFQEWFYDLLDFSRDSKPSALHECWQTD